MTRDTAVRIAGRSGLCLALLGACARPTVVGSAPGSVSAPAATVDVDYRRLEREVLTELNAVRSNPAGYASHLSALLPLYNGTVLKRPGRIGLRTQEGPAAVREAIAALRSQQPLSSLAGSTAIASAARDLVVDQGRTGSVGHSGSDGSSPASRLARYGQWKTSTQENIDYNLVASGREVVMDLLVDDGVPGRGHRHNIFEPTARVAGVACGPHPRFGTVCVIDQAGGFTSR